MRAGNPNFENNTRNKQECLICIKRNLFPKDHNKWLFTIQIQLLERYNSKIKHLVFHSTIAALTIHIFVVCHVLFYRRVSRLYNQRCCKGMCFSVFLSRKSNNQSDVQHLCKRNVQYLCKKTKCFYLSRSSSCSQLYQQCTCGCKRTAAYRLFDNLHLVCFTCFWLNSHTQAVELTHHK